MEGVGGVIIIQNNNGNNKNIIIMMIWFDLNLFDSLQEIVLLTTGNTVAKGQ